MSMSTGMNNAGTNQEFAKDATDLTQLSSREQLSALMDGALPADETRFLLRRLQHDASLAECWERWRLSAEVMRGLAPAQRLPADFAARVAVTLHGPPAHVDAMTDATATGKRGGRAPAWLRWGGGAAVAASLAVVTFMTLPAAVESPGHLVNTNAIAVTDAATSLAPDGTARSTARTPAAPLAPVQAAPVQHPTGAGLGSQTAALASAIAAVSRPSRNTRRPTRMDARQTRSILPAVMHDAYSTQVGAAAGNMPSLAPQADITTRPWPRSVLPQYENAGITVGLGDSARTAAAYNPFLLRQRVGNLPPTLVRNPDSQDAASPAGSRDGNTSDAAADTESPQS